MDINSPQSCHYRGPMGSRAPHSACTRTLFPVFILPGFVVWVLTGIFSSCDYTRQSITTLQPAYVEPLSYFRLDFCSSRQPSSAEGLETCDSFFQGRAAKCWATSFQKRKSPDMWCLLFLWCKYSHQGQFRLQALTKAELGGDGAGVGGT